MFSFLSVSYMAKIWYIGLAVINGTNKEKADMQSSVFVGNVGKTPTLSGVGDRAVCHVVLLSNEYAGKDKTTGKARERTVSIRFTAFRGIAETIAKNVRLGDQIIVNYRVENNNYQKDGEDVYDYNFIINDFDFGAPGKEKRSELRGD